MTVQAMGYFWIGTSKLDDWTGFATASSGFRGLMQRPACLPHGRPEATPGC